MKENGCLRLYPNERYGVKQRLWPQKDIQAVASILFPCFIGSHKRKATCLWELIGYYYYFWSGSDNAPTIFVFIKFWKGIETPIFLYSFPSFNYYSSQNFLSIGYSLSLFVLSWPRVSLVLTPLRNLHLSAFDIVLICCSLAVLNLLS